MFNFSCKDCSERKAGCHATCEKYKQEREALDALNSSVNAEKIAKYYTCDMIAKNKEVINKRKIKRSRYTKKKY